MKIFEQKNLEHGIIQSKKSSNLESNNSKKIENSQNKLISSQPKAANNIAFQNSNLNYISHNSEILNSNKNNTCSYVKSAHNSSIPYVYINLQSQNSSLKSSSSVNKSNSLNNLKNTSKINQISKMPNPDIANINRSYSQNNFLYLNTGNILNNSKDKNNFPIAAMQQFQIMNTPYMNQSNVSTMNRQPHNTSLNFYQI